MATEGLGQSLGLNNEVVIVPTDNNNNNNAVNNNNDAPAMDKLKLLAIILFSTVIGAGVGFLAVPLVLSSLSITISLSAMIGISAGVAAVLFLALYFGIKHADDAAHAARVAGQLVIEDADKPKKTPVSKDAGIPVDSQGDGGAAGADHEQDVKFKDSSKTEGPDKSPVPQNDGEASVTTEEQQQKLQSNSNCEQTLKDAETALQLSSMLLNINYNLSKQTLQSSSNCEQNLKDAETAIVAAKQLIAQYKPQLSQDERLSKLDEKYEKELFNLHQLTNAVTLSDHDQKLQGSLNADQSSEEIEAAVSKLVATKKQAGQYELSDEEIQLLEKQNAIYQTQIDTLNMLTSEEQEAYNRVEQQVRELESLGKSETEAHQKLMKQLTDIITLNPEKSLAVENLEARNNELFNFYSNRTNK